MLGDVDVLEVGLAGAAAAAHMRDALLLGAKAPRQDIDLVLVLVVLALAFDPVDLQKIINCRHISLLELQCVDSYRAPERWDRRTTIRPILLTLCACLPRRLR